MSRQVHGGNGRPRALTIALLLVVPLLIVTATSPAQASSTVRVLEITEDSVGNSEPWKQFDGNPLKLYDFDKDGDQEIIAQNDNQWVYIFDSRDGDLLAEVRNPVPSWWGARSFNGPEVTVMEDGGSVRLILANSAAILSSWRFDAASSSQSHFVLHKEWQRTLHDCGGEQGMDGKPVFADLDKDGDLDIAAATEDSGVYALRKDGSLLWRQCNVGGGNASPGIGDIDQNGFPDVVHASDGGTVAVFHGRTGNYMWAANVKDHANLGSGSIPVQPGIGQLDGRGGPDIVVGARDSHDTSNYDNDHAALVAFSSGGGLLWKFQDFEKGNPLTYTRPVIADTDHNGVNEVYWGDWNTIGHKGGIPEEDWWSTTGPANYYRLDNHGNMVWRQTLDTYWSNKDVPLADVDDDGVQEMLANGPSSGDGIWYLDSRHGGKESWISVHPWKVMRAPVVGELYGDGTMQWVVQVAPATSWAGGHAILVYDTHAAYDSDWPHPPYPDQETAGDGGGDSGGDTGDDTGDFDASFSGVKGNEWWIQTQVSTSGGTLSKVDVRLDGGSWKPLEDKGWGWAASYHAPEGTVVQLRATSTGGATDLSGCYRWTDATSVECGSSSPPPSGDFAASFSGVQGNEWWIQTQVSTSGDTLSGVDVRLDGGSWKPLEDKGWGWAASYHAPEGTIVQLRATSSGGATDLSDCYRWTAATKTDCSGGGGSAFTASFDPKAVGNDWWVETAVTANEPVVKVEAQVDGGSWTALAKTDWGTWAESIHAPDGSQVRFRAHADSGETVTSGTYTWT